MWAACPVNTNRITRPAARGCRKRNKKKKLGVSNTPYDGGRWVTDGGRWVTDGGWWATDGGWWVTDGGWWATDGGWWATDGGWWATDGGWWVTDGGWWATDGGWWATDGGWCVTDGGWWVTDGGWWVATKHQRVVALVKNKKKNSERPNGNPCRRPLMMAWRGYTIDCLRRQDPWQPEARQARLRTRFVLWSDGSGGNFADQYNCM